MCLFMLKIPVLAQEDTIDIGSHDGSVESNFTADNLIANGVTVSLPANLDLHYYENYDAFVAKGEVCVGGRLKPTAAVSVFIPREIVYTNTNSKDTVVGYAKFGQAIEERCVASWNAEEVDAKTIKTVLIQVPADTIPTNGSYHTSVEFEIKTGLLGMDTELCIPEEIDGSDIVQTNEASYSWKEGMAYPKSINLSKIEPIQNNNTPFYATKDASYENVHYIELGSGNGKLIYKKGWLSQFPNLKAVILPKNLQSYQIDGTSSFVKGMSEEGAEICVPHIMYRGTTDEWSSSFASQFRNNFDLANLVTIHCQDGKIIY